jgi:hypothetical protein
LYEVAARNRSAEAALALGYMYHWGIEVEQVKEGEGRDAVLSVAVISHS